MGFQSLAPFSANDIQKFWPELSPEILGSTTHPFEFINPALESGEEDVVFAHQDKIIASLAGKSVGLIVVPPKFRENLKSITYKSAILSPEPEVLMAMVLNKFFQKTPDRGPEFMGFHETAVVHATASVHPSAILAPFAVIGQNVVVGPKCYIGAHTVVEHDAVLGEDVTLHPMVYLGPRTVIKDRAEIHANTTIGKEGLGYALNKKGEQIKIPHLGKVVIEEDVHIGANCSIDRGTLGDTVIGRGTKMDNQCHVAHNCKIGRYGMITAHFVIAGSSTIGDYFVCGGKTVVGGHLKIADRVQLAGLSAVSKNIDEPGAYGGYPIQPVKVYLKNRALQAHLHNFKKDIALLKKKLDL